ncbi:MAG TPA: helix-hairpin-helix domain-containing protein [Sulfurovum sp.]|jgi:competence protein ComEA|nr:MAG: transporter [Sulfurovum sp. 35-42-20]OYZ26439.1 MAG: transporter [Sulfurovum sp. 16-42-52]OYZ48553.1 MAG: transporter [Sulfurovum sp. 24-42-9]OZA46359.1 MAG: transporter [Sulfurovum sp. 17-42-90]OZA60892.1 MAG: transporter [Sulfurovum sp. 39-42-12]HQR74459.1 helix-hairpin-helix domain-containing protein [Sulfurovum sp.]
MFHKVITGFLVLATSTVFGMSLNQLNSASKEELMEINGIGEKKADAIIAERKKGEFKSFEDFQRVDGIGEQTAANVKNDVKSAGDVKKVEKKSKKASKEREDKVEKKTKKTKKDAEETVEKQSKKAKKDTEDAVEKKAKKAIPSAIL